MNEAQEYQRQKKKTKKNTELKRKKKIYETK